MEKKFSYDKLPIDGATVDMVWPAIDDDFVLKQDISLMCGAIAWLLITPHFLRIHKFTMKPIFLEIKSKNKKSIFP